MTGWNVAVGPKRLELLHQLIPTATVMALLVNRTSPDLAKADVREQQAAARTLGQTVGMRNRSACAKMRSRFAAVKTFGITMTPPGGPSAIAAKTPSMSSPATR